MRNRSTKIRHKENSIKQQLRTRQSVHENRQRHSKRFVIHHEIHGDSRRKASRHPLTTIRSRRWFLSIQLHRLRLRHNPTPTNAYPYQIRQSTTHQHPTLPHLTSIYLSPKTNSLTISTHPITITIQRQPISIHSSPK